ncbi:MAG: hypothetical protein DHS20C02_11500 [Micavibrio sp.]|nr:MAG: hypothetical protein DHS20C02_11500 [Micavibrio sp.]
MFTDGKQKFNNLKLVGYDGTDHSGRHQMYQILQQWLDDKESTQVGYFLAIGIDRLSLFNEAFGTDYADTLIEETGKHLDQILGSSFIIKRVSGATYGAFIDKASVSEMPTMAQHIINSFYEMPLRTEMGPVRIGISVGGIALEDQGMSPSSMLTKAELALRAAKDSGRGRFVSYADTAEQSKNYRTMLTTGDSFLKALKEHRVRLAFQPVVDSKTNKVSFYECLARIVGENGDIINAAQFIPAVEELGLARVLDKYTMHLAIQELGMFPDIKLSVNVSNWSLTDPHWLDSVVLALNGRRDVAERLIIEITESVAIQDMQKTEDFIGILKGLGCRIALDDFGAGYTAFSQLKTLNIDIVKIDQSFVRDIDDKKGHLFVKTLQSLAEGIDVETVGEGAETKGEADILANDGIHHIQGFFCGKPSTERLWLAPDHVYRKFPVDAALLDADLVPGGVADSVLEDG